MKVHIPVGRQVLIDRHEAEDSYKGFEIPQENRTEKSEGTIVRVSPDTDHFEVGDIVIFDKYTNLLDVEEYGKTLYLLPADKIFAIKRDE